MKEHEIKMQEKIQQQINLENLAKNNQILRVVAGSHAYGTNIPSSDWDERGIFIDIPQRVCLPFEKIEQVQLSENDVVLYELSKYFNLLLSQNPNVLELIWAAPQDVLFKNEAGTILLDNREKFLSNKVQDTYVGYADSQLKRIKGHNKWINNPQPENEPEMKDYFSIVFNHSEKKEFNKKIRTADTLAVSIGNDNFMLFSQEKLKNIELPFKDKNTWFDNKGNPLYIKLTDFNHLVKDQPKIFPEMLVKLNKGLYQDAHDNWKNYWTWKKNRNEKRSNLEEQFGYDTKHAMHLIRLLRSGVDILKYGVVPVKREDKDYLLDIRFGKYTYDEIVKESERLKDEVKNIGNKANLPDEPNYSFAKSIMMEMYSQQWGVHFDVKNILSEQRKNKP